MSKSDKKIPLMEMFGPTIQGEGALCGYQTYFMRFGLCDYECTMCDSLHAVKPESVKRLATWETQNDIVGRFQELTEKNENVVPWVTYSGGNPCIHDLTDLTETLHDRGFRINVETQGTLCPSWLANVDMVTISPKSPGMGEKFDPEMFEHMLAFLAENNVPIVVKIVVFSARDLEFASMVFRRADEMLDGYLASYRGFLSLGNPYPPGHDNLVRLENDIVDVGQRAAELQAELDDQIKLRLLQDYRLMAEDILKDPRFADICFLPQLHVLTWANKAEV